MIWSTHLPTLGSKNTMATESGWEEKVAKVADGFCKATIESKVYCRYGWWWHKWRSSQYPCLCQCDFLLLPHKCRHWQLRTLASPLGQEVSIPALIFWSQLTKWCVGDVAISSASFILLSSNLQSLLTLSDLSRKVFNRVKQNFVSTVQLFKQRTRETHTLHSSTP